MLQAPKMTKTRKQGKGSPKMNPNGSTSQNKSTMSKSAKRRARQAVAPYRSEGVYPSIQAPGVSSGPIQRAKFSAASKILTSARVSEGGLAFLKCAFAPPDFDQTRVQGAPDKFEGQSLVKKHRLVTPETFEAARDVYYILAPVPGVAYFRASVGAGGPIGPATPFQAVHYSDAVSMFGDNTGQTAGDKVTKFRYVSSHIEFVPTTNQMTWSGNIQSWKMPISVEVRNAAASTGVYGLTGLQGCNATNANQYTGPFNLGVYTACYSKASTFEFNPVIEGNPAIPADLATAGTFGQFVGTTSNLPGFDNSFDSLVVKVSGVGSNASNTCIIKTWACVEYQVLAGTDLYEYTTFSPCDELAIAIYKKVVNELPVGVAFTDNEGFWRRVLQIIRNMSGGLSVLPGHYGMAASGVHMLSSAIDALTL